MSKDLNQCNFIGRLGKDPDLRYTPSGDAVCNFSIACGDDYKDKNGQKVEQTEWIRVTAFRRLAEIIGEYCKKGSMVYISGKMRTRKWQDQSGNDRYTTEIVANEMQMLDSRGAAGESAGGNAGAGRRADGGQSSAQPATDFDDDIPF